jgi:membrane protein
MKFILKSFLKFIKKDIWETRIDDYQKLPSFFIRHYKIIVLSIKGFFNDNYMLRASGLTFYSMLSIVPVMAMIFGIAKGFGLEKLLENLLREKFADKEEILSFVLKFSNSLLETTRGGIIAGVGFLMLIWTIMSVLGNIEDAFNNIWKIKTPRTLLRKLTDYISIMIIAPIFIILASSATVFLSTHIMKVSKEISLFNYLGPFLYYMLKFSPYVLIWLLFTLIYMVMPNTKVNFKSALVAGIFAGTIYQIVQWFYIRFQIGVAHYNAIYGSFAALPMFLIWLQISWLIVLLGAKISFTNQNIRKYEFGEEDTIHKISYLSRKQVALIISIYIIRAFKNKEKPLTIDKLASTLKIPLTIIEYIIKDLIVAGIISEVRLSNNNFAYQPAIDINSITITYVLENFEKNTNKQLNLSEQKYYLKINEILEHFNKVLENTEYNILLKDI